MVLLGNSGPLGFRRRDWLGMWSAMVDWELRRERKRGLGGEGCLDFSGGGSAKVEGDVG